jgi:hypothetical protein
MLLLDHKGKPQMGLEGGELIISRGETKKLIDAVVKTKENGMEEKDLIAVGKMMHEIRMKQRNRKPEFTKD